MSERVFDRSIELKDNAMLKVNPELFHEWDFEKNDELGLNIYKVTKGVRVIAWWICGKCTSPYDSYIFKRAGKGKAGCPYCSGSRVNHTNSLAILYPELAKEWHTVLNGDLTPNDVTFGRAQKAWWKCPKCKSDYDSIISSRASQGTGCPYCAGQKVNHTNSLASINPKLASEWHPTLNGKLTPDDVTCGRTTKAWWLGSECGHPWDAPIYDREKGEQGCPICSGHRVLKGFNDMWTTNPRLASLLADPEDGYRYTQMSSKRVNWKCNKCANIINNRVISDICNTSLSCPRCSDGVSFPEKFMYNLLRKYNIDFEYNTAQEWSDNKRYDFYLLDYNWIIETHGGQHYGDGFSEFEGGRVLIEEQENDRLKEDLAKENGIDNYIVIDCRHSTVDWISVGVLNSDIMKFAKDIDFIEIGEQSTSSLVKEASILWSNDIRSTKKISEIMKLDRSTIINYLKRGAEIGWCDYCPNEAIRESSAEMGLKRSRKVLQISKEGVVLKEWESMSTASKSLSLSVSVSGIAAVCQKRSKTCGGFIWSYKEDYCPEEVDSLVHRILSPVERLSLRKRVIQLNLKFDFIKEWDSASKAKDVLGINNISTACKGRLKTAGGFKWMYKEDYDEFISNQNNQKEIS